MAKSIINIGTAANDGTGDSIRAGATKINANSDELYNALGDGVDLKTIINSDLEIDVPPVDGKINKISVLCPSTAERDAIEPGDYHGTILHVHQTGGVYVAHSNAWRGLLLDASAGAIPNYTDPLSAVAYGGTLNDITDVDTESVTPFTGAVLKYDGTKWAPGTDVTQGGAGLDADTLDGQDGSYYLNWNNFSNKPTIPSTLTDLSIDDGTNGQVLGTDGAGNFAFVDQSGGGGSQNLFATFTADTGSTTANSQTDTLTVAGGTNISTVVQGDTLTINYVGDALSGEANQDAFSFVNGDSGIAAADNATDTLTIAGGTDISTSVSGDTITISYTGGGVTFANLTDTDITSPVDGAVLVYDGTNWANAPQTIDQIAYPAITTLKVEASGSTGYLFDQYGTTQDPTIYAISGTTIAFNLNDATLSSHPFQIETSGGLAYNTGLVHVANDGTVSEGSDAQGQTSGTLYWKIPHNISGNYAYQCTVHSAMRGNITIKDISAL
jgi:plastocyanin